MILFFPLNRLLSTLLATIRFINWFFYALYRFYPRTFGVTAHISLFVVSTYIYILDFLATANQLQLSHKSRYQQSWTLVLLFRTFLYTPFKFGQYVVRQVIRLHSP